MSGISTKNYFSTIRKMLRNILHFTKKRSHYHFCINVGPSWPIIFDKSSCYKDIIHCPLSSTTKNKTKANTHRKGGNGSSINRTRNARTGKTQIVNAELPGTGSGPETGCTNCGLWQLVRRGQAQSSRGPWTAPQINLKCFTHRPSS